MAFTVLTGEIAHETNTFSIEPTTLERFRQRLYLLGNAIPAATQGTHGSFGATFEAAERYGWNLRHPIAASATPSAPFLVKPCVMVTPSSFLYSFVGYCA